MVETEPQVAELAGELQRVLSRVFSVLRRNPDFTDHVDILCAEHAALDEMAERIRSGESGLIDRFVTELRDHINKENQILFPTAQDILSDAEVAEVAEKMGL